MVAVAVVMFVQGSRLVLAEIKEVSLDSACTDNMSELLAGLIAYCQDNDNRLPPRPANGDWVATRWTPGKRWSLSGRVAVPKIVEPGPLARYVPEPFAWCPPDRGPASAYTKRGGYEWNMSLAGKTLDEVVDKPVVWPYGAWSRNGRWVGTIRISSGEPGHPQGAKGPSRQWVREEDFQQVIRSGKLPTYKRTPDEG